MVSFIHCADLHLDKSFGFSSHKTNNNRKQDLLDRFDEVCSYALKEKPNLFFISGDIFDKINPSNEARIFLADRLRKLKEKKIESVMIGGNHDVSKDYKGRPMAIDILDSVGISTVFSSRDKFEKKIFPIDNKKVVIIGKSFNQLNDRYNPLTKTNFSCDGDINILILHASYTGGGIKPTIVEKQDYQPFSRNDLKGLNLDYVALGHYHNNFEVELQSGTLIANPGSLERFSFNERKEDKGFIWGEITSAGVQTSFVKVNARKMSEKSIQLKKEQNNHSELIKGKLANISDRELILRVNLKGEITLNQMNQLNLREVIRFYDDDFMALDFNRTDLSIEEFGKIFVEKIEHPKQAFSNMLETKITESSIKSEKELFIQVKEKGLEYFQEMGG